MRHRFVTVLAAALALTLGTATAAGAVWKGSTPWVSAVCATGQFTALGADGGQTAVYGEVTPCTPHHPVAAFTLVAFHPAETFAHAYSNQLVTYDSAGATPFAGVFRSAPPAGEVGVCAMLSLTRRIACVRVTFPVGGPATMEPIPTTDPLVTQTVFYVEGESTPPPGGFCGTCLELPVE